MQSMAVFFIVVYHNLLSDFIDLIIHVFLGIALLALGQT